MFYKKDKAQLLVGGYSTLRLMVEIEVRAADGDVRYIPTSVALSHDDADRILGGVDDDECIELVARGNHIALVANCGK